MEERTYTSYYRPLPLVQRSEVASRGRVTPSRDEYARRETSYTRDRERVDRYAADDDSPSFASGRTYRTGRSSFRIVEGERDTSDVEGTSLGRGYGRRQRRAGDAPRSGRSSSASRPRRRRRVEEDDFDDYYALWDDDIDDADEYEEPTDDYPYDDAYDDREPMRGRTRSRRGGTRPAPARRPAISIPSFSLVDLLALPFVGIRNLMAYHLRFCAFALAIALTYAMLFVPVRNLYIAHRQLEDLQATYEALEAENQAIRDEINYLQTDGGVETEARRRGYVEDGETKVVVEGLPETEDTDPTSALAPREVVDDRSWVVRFFDRVFGYGVDT